MMNKIKQCTVQAKSGLSIVLATLLLFFSYGCNSDSAPDCFKNAGELKRFEVSVSDFNQITVFEKIRLVLKVGVIQKVEIETGEYLKDGVTAVVTDNRLVLRNSNSCNYTRDYGLTTVYITSPNISEIRSSTGLPIKSDGVLNYPTLSLLSESYVEPEAETTDGEFDLQLNVQSLSIVVNGIAYFNLSGTAETASFVVASGDSRIEAADLKVNKVVLNHRGSNDIYIYPINEITGEIRSLGDVICGNKPPVVAVKELYKGKLIFN